MLLDVARTEAFKVILTEDILNQIQSTADNLISTVGRTDVDLMVDPSYVALYAYYNALKQISEGDAIFAMVVDRLRHGDSVVHVPEGSSFSLDSLIKRIERVTLAVNDFKMRVMIIVSE